MNINPSIFKAYDIRGIYPQDIDEEGIADLARGVYTFFAKTLKKKDLQIILGYDMRTSTPQLFEAAKNAFIESGATVIDIGLVATPTLYFSTLHYMADASVMVTASHNPKEYNGIKFVIRKDKKIIKIGKGSGMDEVKEYTLNKTFEKTGTAGKLIKVEGAVKEEVDYALQLINPSEIKKFKIITDTANGMAITYLNELFKNVPAEIIKMNEKLDGTFPAHEANPLKFETLKDLQKKVIEEKADIGIAPDADGDRIFFIDEKGEVIPATLISALVSQEILEKEPNQKILIDIRYLRNPKKAVEDNGGTMSISKVGHAFITKQLEEENGVFGGESSGHFFFRRTGYAESSVTVVLFVLELMSKENKPLSEILKKFHTSVESGETNYELSKETNAKDLLLQISTYYKDGDISELDGLSVTYPSWRFNMRTSNTEPLLRLNVEGESKELVEQKVTELKDKILASGAKPK